MSTRIRLLIASLVFTVVAVGTSLWSAAQFEEAKAARIALEDSEEIQVDSVYSDRVESRFDPDYDRTRYQEIAAHLAEDPVYVDEYMAWSVDDAGLEAIRAEVADLDDPIVVVFLPVSKLDDADGEWELVADRIARELTSETGTVLLMTEVTTDTAGKGLERRAYDSPDVGLEASLTEEALAWVRALKAVEPSEPWEDPVYAADPNDRLTARTLTYHPAAAISAAVAGLLAGVAVAGIGVLVLRRRRRRHEEDIASVTAGSRT